MTDWGIGKPRRKVNRDLLDEIKKLPCCCCGSRYMVDPSHVKTVKSSGDDARWNVFPKCRICHNLWHSLGPKRFFARYPSFEKLLMSVGWEWLEGKLYHPNARY